MLAGAAPPPTREGIYDVFEQLGCIQIDTLNLVQRSQYLALWSRLGTYNPHDLDAVAYGDGAGNERRLFEYWLKEACLIPLSEYRYRMSLMRWHAEGNSRWGSTWASHLENSQVIDLVRARIAAEGGLRSADFDHKGKRPGSWWNWKPAKRALEYLYNSGELMISGRRQFQRVYDLRERVLPDWVDATEPPEEDTIRHLVRRGAKALGVFAPLQAADYLRVKRTEAKPIVQKLIADGELIPIRAVLHDGNESALVVYRDLFPLLEQAADGALPATRTTFLSPFDNLFWAKGRDQQFWGFTQRLEAYVPAPKRVWGYYCLPILHHDRLVGRFDPKLERKTGLLRLKALHLEPGVKPDAALVRDVAAAMRAFMAFHKATDLAIEKSAPAAFGAKLLKAV
jgi:uncharacterized protein YcaQ